MQSIGDMPINQAIELYFEKHHALREGDMMRLIDLKKQCPALFIKENDEEIRDLIMYAKEFELSPRYQKLRRLLLKEQLKIVPDPKQ